MMQTDTNYKKLFDSVDRYRDMILEAERYVRRQDTESGIPTDI